MIKVLLIIGIFASIDVIAATADVTLIFKDGEKKEFVFSDTKSEHNIESKIKDLLCTLKFVKGESATSSQVECTRFETMPKDFEKAVLTVVGTVVTCGDSNSTFLKIGHKKSGTKHYDDLTITISCRK